MQRTSRATRWRRGTVAMTSQASHHGGCHGGGGWMGCDGVGWVGRASWSWLSAGVVQRCRTAVQARPRRPGHGRRAAAGTRPHRRSRSAPTAAGGWRPGGHRSSASAACPKARSAAGVQSPAALAGQTALGSGAPPSACNGGPAHSAAGQDRWDRPANRADPVMTAHPARRNLQAEHGLHNVLQAPSSRQRQEGERAHVRGNRHEADGDRRWRQGRGTAAATLRDEGFDGPVVLISREPEIPFGRPPLSKTYLRSEEGLDDWYVRPAGWYEANDVELRTDSVVAVDPQHTSWPSARAGTWSTGSS